MKAVSGKWYLVLLMVICLGILVIAVSEERKQNTFESITKQNTDLSEKVNADNINKEKSRLDNEELYLVKQGINTIYLDGKGILVQEDFNALLRNEGILNGEVTNLVIGSGVTEIGYKTLVDLPYLRTLKFSEGLKKIGNGAVVNNQSLAYVYLPESIECVGIDFLAGCDNPYIITNQGKSKLPEMKYVAKDHVLTNIQTYNELKDRLLSLPQIYDCSVLLVNTPDRVEEKDLLIPSGYGQYGPNTELQAGYYHVVYEGEGFKELTVDSLRVCDAEVTDFIVQELSIQDKRISFSFESQKNIARLNFVLMNTSAEQIRIERILLYDTEISLPKEIKEWFD